MLNVMLRTVNDVREVCLKLLILVNVEFECIIFYVCIYINKPFSNLFLKIHHINHQCRIQAL